MKRLVKIDLVASEDHSYIDVVNDECYYFGLYTSHKNYAYSEMNSDISNIKKKPTASAAPGFHYKEATIRKLAKYLSGAIDEDLVGEATFVPVPPSKAKDHADYDDRMLRMLKHAFPHKSADIRELIFQVESTVASHETSARPDIDDIYDNIEIDEDLVDGVRKTIVIVDDVLTNGTHFKAMKRLLRQRFPEANIIGIFICRRVFPEDEDDDF